MRIEQLTAAESGWRAVFTEPNGSESMSRIVGWAVGDDGDVVGLIVDPTEPSRVVGAAGATSPDGGTFLRYRYVAPEPIVIQPPPPPPASVDETAEQIAKGFLKRKK
jgi:hypothetical protein